MEKDSCNIVIVYLPDYNLFKKQPEHLRHVLGHNSRAVAIPSKMLVPIDKAETDDAGERPAKRARVIDSPPS